MHSHRAKPLAVALVLLLGLLVASGARPYDRATWAMEVFPIFIAVPVLWATHSRFPLTTLLYVCIFLHALVLMLGGAYTYARVPLGFQVADVLGLDRNPYDKIGHFFQGFVPALVAREILIRGAYVQGRKMLAFVVVCMVLAISATYELTRLPLFAAIFPNFHEPRARKRLIDMAWSCAESAKHVVVPTFPLA